MFATDVYILDTTGDDIKIGGPNCFGFKWNTATVSVNIFLFALASFLLFSSEYEIRQIFLSILLKTENSGDFVEKSSSLHPAVCDSNRGSLFCLKSYKDFPQTFGIK